MLLIFFWQLPYFSRMIRIVILGAGNIAQHLYSAFRKQNSVAIVQCYNRRGLSLHPDQEKNTITDDIKLLKEADLYILAVSDDAIGEISEKLPFENRFVVHTSGSVPMQALDNSNQKGVFYPLQSFSKDKKVDFSTIPICIETDQEKNVMILEKLATTLSQKVYKISSEQRNILHVSAVFVNNFTNYLFSVGNDICKENNIPFEILHPLLLETAQKAIEIDPNKAQTGPAIRNDYETIARHLKILSNTSHKEAYKALTKAIQSKYGKKL